MCFQTKGKTFRAAHYAKLRALIKVLKSLFKMDSLKKKRHY